MNDDDLTPEERSRVDRLIDNWKLELFAENRYLYMIPSRRILEKRDEFEVLVRAERGLSASPLPLPHRAPRGSVSQYPDKDDKMKNQLERLSARGRERGLVVVPTPKDCNCFLHAVGCAPDNFVQQRRAIVTALHQGVYPVDKAWFIIDQTSWENEMTSDGWFDELAIHLWGLLNEMRVEIISPNGDRWNGEVGMLDAQQFVTVGHVPDSYYVGFRYDRKAEDNNKADLFRIVGFAASSKRMVDLHAHLLGMGNADFWLRIMREYLPEAEYAVSQKWRNTARGRPKPKWESWDTLAGALMDVISKSKSKIGVNKRWCLALRRIVEDPSLAFSTDGPAIMDHDLLAVLKTKEERVGFMLEHFTTDVVYSQRRLAIACGIASSESAVLSRQECSQLEVTLNNASGSTALSNNFKYHVIFNSRKGQMQLCFGIANDDLIPYLIREDPRGRESALLPIVRNWFEFCSSDGGGPSDAHINAYFRGNFTPQFYPRRFIIKDALYEQRLEVLAILLNHVVSRYGDAGVAYVELSLGAKDIMNAGVLSTIHACTFSSPLISVRKHKKKRTQQDKADDEFIDDDDIDESDDEDIETEPVPKVLQLNSVRPSWRAVLGGVYEEKPRNFVTKFLAAFTRGIKWNMLPVGLRKPLNGEKAMWMPVTQGERTAAEGSQREVLSPLQCLQSLVNDASRQEPPVSISELADLAVTDDWIDIIYKDQVDLATRMLSALQTNGDLIFRYVVGLDWVGDETGHPYCALPHRVFIDIVKAFRRRTGNDNFGVRVHGGEGVQRSPLFSEGAAWQKLIGDGHTARHSDDAFELHVRIVMATIKKLYALLNDRDFDADTPLAKMGGRANSGDELFSHPRIRIGHGVALLYRDHEIDSSDALHIALEEFCIRLCLLGIVCELNPTSNHMLLADAGVLMQRGNTRSLPHFLTLGLPVILCTDDDGVWSIPKCVVHDMHVSVAHEFCDSIRRGEIRNARVLEDMLNAARDCCFSPVRDGSQSERKWFLLTSSSSDGLDSKSKDELIRLCKAKGLTFTSTTSEPQLVAMLRDSMAATQRKGKRKLRPEASGDEAGPALARHAGDDADALTPQELARVNEMVNERRVVAGAAAFPENIPDERVRQIRDECEAIVRRARRRAHGRGL